ncbi:hypothetical protein MUK42_04387 [Musa troglodytarum]|uniref:Uncharacterized protein n=1 Tax=Musa troglodytarum TaxID=320322 RepID=A0A9E7KR62_9LILI|nr:hypothetical protein MUK42_04387 [Musa troglodytarum]
MGLSNLPIDQAASQPAGTLSSRSTSGDPSTAPPPPSKSLVTSSPSSICANKLTSKAINNLSPVTKEGEGSFDYNTANAAAVEMTQSDYFGKQTFLHKWLSTGKVSSSFLVFFTGQEM